jgi:hypothetical protein
LTRPGEPEHAEREANASNLGIAQVVFGDQIPSPLEDSTLALCVEEYENGADNSTYYGA